MYAALHGEGACCFYAYVALYLLVWNVVLASCCDCIFMCGVTQGDLPGDFPLCVSCARRPHVIEEMTVL